MVGIGLRAFLHCGNILIAMLIKFGNFLQNNIRKIIILNNNAVALCLEGGGIQFLIAAPRGERNRTMSAMA